MLGQAYSSGMESEQKFCGYFCGQGTLQFQQLLTMY